MDATIRLEETWKAVLAPEFRHSYMADLKRFLMDEKEQGRQIFPRGSEYFRALDLTPLDRVRVVILGQDPYHGDGQAHGLCFSVRPGMRIPPSLVNIYKELRDDLGIAPARHGFLESWAGQGVLLLNAVLTVERGRAASHQGRGWERFTDAVVRAINEREQPVVFMLWGSYAQRKAAFVDRSRHLVLTAAHPSPLSAHSGFFGCRHFSKANAFLQSKGFEPIDWQLPEDPPLAVER
ncbi:uracil-DNA glycosylase [Sinorhizobium saheli]|uniref:Uracil-DNA glycosylase n=1 Tax=Sinorhizobium saheli TaxID=36856 RepID=A0A178XKN7_SINSA|nr:uracil-DNA glycosylase [Sinorhizobium saheli]MQW87598.1 uracil-DNA glycosylase [Sinorhizobium saheli]OAP35790.1 uracil-DNA glycosylase [Sinorhizobium saheli]